MGVAFSGQGSLQQAGFAFTGKGAMVSHDASQALMLIGFEAPPSAEGVPLKLRFELMSQRVLHIGLWAGRLVWLTHLLYLT